jgi:hypothetical protein
MVVLLTWYAAADAAVCIRRIRLSKNFTFHTLIHPCSLDLGAQKYLIRVGEISVFYR